MTGQLCLDEKPNPKPSGRAKRGGDFALVTSLAKSFKPGALTGNQIDRALASIGGLPETDDNDFDPSLSHGAFRLLHFYTTRLNMKELPFGKTTVWPGAELTARRLGISPSMVRRYKRELEDKRYIIRNYDQENRPLYGEAIDLCPFLLAVPSLIQKAEAEDKKYRDEKAARRQEGDGTSNANTLTRACTSAHQNRTPDSAGLCLEIIEKKGSPTGKVDDVASNVTSPETDHADSEIIAKTLKISPRLRSALLYDDVAISPKEAIRRLYPALPSLFPNAHGTNIGHTLRWAIQKYGIRVFEVIAVCVEDPNVRSPHQYFGRLASQTEQADLTTNLARLRELNPPAPEIDLPKSPVAQTIAEAVSKAVSVSKYNAWFKSDETHFRQEGTNLIVETTNSLARDWIENRLWSGLKCAARTLGLESVKVRQVEQLSYDGPDTRPKLIDDSLDRPDNTDASRLLKKIWEDDRAVKCVA